MRQTLGSLLLLLSLGGELMAQNPSPRPPVLRVACVGDSITWGAGTPNPATDGYPALLAQRLGGRYDVRNFGVSGTTMLRKSDYPYVSTPEFQQAGALEPDIVILMLGTNDSKVHNWRGAEAFAADVRAMIDHFAALPSKPRVWLCIPPPFVGILQTFNASNLERGVIPTLRQVAAEKSVPIIDVYAAMEGKPGLLPDGVHPDARGARIIADTVYAALETVKRAPSAP
jgi:lysophospholipase L1-like esterase